MGDILTCADIAIFCMEFSDSILYELFIRGVDDASLEKTSRKNRSFVRVTNIISFFQKPIDKKQLFFTKYKQTFDNLYSYHILEESECQEK